MSNFKKGVKRFFSKIGIGFELSHKQLDLFNNMYKQMICDSNIIYDLNKKLKNNCYILGNDYKSSSIFNRKKRLKKYKNELIKYHALKEYIDLVILSKVDSIKKDEFKFIESFYNVLLCEKDCNKSKEIIYYYIDSKYHSEIENLKKCNINNQIDLLDKVVKDYTCPICGNNLFLPNDRNINKKCKNCGYSSEGTIRYNKKSATDLQSQNNSVNCKYCGANFYQQESFNIDKSHHVCEVCGNINYSDEILWYCDKCGCFMNEQTGFNTLSGKWICQECDFINDVTKDNIIEEKSDVKSKTQTIMSSNVSIDDLIGLQNVKEQIRRMKAILIKNKGRENNINLHMCFYGNPGTGKTIVARLMANIFYELGILPTNNVIETDRAGLVGEYVGQTAPKTHAIVEEAMGGVLFIDEAYTLSSKSGSSSDFGNEAIAALLKDMEDYKGKFCVILAGYRDEMENMISVNPGFDSRINRKIDFPDYTIDELMQIFSVMLKKEDYEIEKNAYNKVKEIFAILSKREKFANGRTVKNVVDSLTEIQAVRTIEDNDKKNDNERIIKIIDVFQYEKEIL